MDWRQCKVNWRHRTSPAWDRNTSKTKKFILCIKPKDQNHDVQFEMQNLAPRDSSTPGNPRCFCYMLNIDAKFYFCYKENLAKLINFHVPWILGFFDNFK